ncbi:MAG: glutamate--tRNA ligase [Candidatus Pelagibacterales bacterium]|jgi:glutamyl-tRNA synthetase|nr:glutamate--tRNA ligase [Pelagibacterales bacterium SAG-MED32]
MTTVTRFAPSPTGLLHLGNIRTALINWLYARTNNGKFILRIDDTDLERSKDEYISQIKYDLDWLGIDYDETFNQSSRFDRYREQFEKLKADGRIYPCYETPEELERKRKLLIAAGGKQVYDRSAMELTDQQKKDYEAEGRKPHWRFLLKTERMKWDDLLKGEIDIDLTSLSDPVLFREDGVPLYTFSSAVDDIDYDITNVIRGDDHTSNTAVQVEIINALDQNKITFAHHALLKASSGDKLSKRDNVISISSFREANMEPISILSLLATIGTSNSIELKDNIDQIKSEFKLSTISTSPGRIEIDVLNALNKKQVQKYNFSEIEERLKKIDEKIDQKFWETIRGNLNVVEDIKQWTDIVFNSETIKPSDKDYIKIAMELIPDDPWNDETWGLWTSAIKEKTGRKGKELFLPLREAFTGLNHGPEMKLLIQLLGREKIIERVEL